ncbi:TNT domain-containing protein [Actinomadura violacea]|uniref:TNT domain-containing protein n=1 Tax=Actinomadura violacea TaxID=2819934 RepID=UPI0027DD349F|nr:TNT domain-containing protein [Actinomadura violacea]
MTVARDYDTQLLESVAVRRRRLRDAVMFGPVRARRTLDESLGKVVAGLCVAAVLCAGLVGWSFLQTKLATQKKQQQQAEQAQAAPPDDGTAPVPAEWVGSQVTFLMLRRELTKAGVPRSLYVLPGEPRPPVTRVSSYYVLSRAQDGFSGGVVEFEQGRIGAELPTEDEACRWLYGELVIRQTAPASIAPQAEAQALQDGRRLAETAHQKINAAGMGATNYLLPQGTLVDAFGQESGSVLSPYGTPFAERGLPASARLTVDPSAPLGYRRYRVVKPLPVSASVSGPSAGGAGGGVRFTVTAGLFPRPPALPTVRWLLRNGYLERLTASFVPR